MEMSIRNDWLLQRTMETQTDELHRWGIDADAAKTCGKRLCSLGSDLENNHQPCRNWQCQWWIWRAIYRSCIASRQSSTNSPPCVITLNARRTICYWRGWLGPPKYSHTCLSDSRGRATGRTRSHGNVAPWRSRTRMASGGCWPAFVQIDYSCCQSCSWQSNRPPTISAFGKDHVSLGFTLLPRSHTSWLGWYSALSVAIEAPHSHRFISQMDQGDAGLHGSDVEEVVVRLPHWEHSTLCCHFADGI